MATFLSKLFKPKWQSKHWETRKEALETLDEFKADDLAILTQLAETDPHSEIQQAAIQKISDTSTLIKLHKKAKDSAKEALEKRLYQLATAQSLSIFDLILDQDLLTEMITKAHQAESYIRGLARIENPQVLFTIASQSRNAQIRQAAAELIETEKELNDLFAHAKNKDKTVFQITKNKLAALRSLAQQKTEQEQQVSKLLSDLDTLHNTEALQHFDARLSHLDKQWQAVKSFATDDQLKTYNKLWPECEQKRDSLIETKAESEPPQAETIQIKENNDEIDATLAAIDSTLSRFQTQAAKPTEVSALDALIKTQENRWLEASKEAEVSKTHQKHYADGMLQLRHYIKSMRHFIEHQDDLSASITLLKDSKSLSPIELEQQRKQLNQSIKDIDWPVLFLQPDLLKQAQDALKLSKERKQELIVQQKKIEAIITQQIEKMDSALEEKQIKQAAQQLKDIQANLSQLEKRQADKFQQGLALRINQLNELRDWQGYVSTPKQEELCEAMEKLAETHIDPNDKADKIKQMQQEWKALGGTGNQALWQRFKTAADKAFEPCALFFGEQKQLKEANLNKRKTLLDQLKGYLSSIDWEAAGSHNSHPSWKTEDWKTAAKINRQAKQEWKDAFPVDFKQNKPFQTEFSKLIDQFDEHLEKERQHNISLKQSIVEKAQALAESDDIEAGIQAVKLLQEQWQKIGITHHKADRKLWAEYRSACDSLFEKRNQAREEKRSELDQLIQQANDTSQRISADAESAATKTKDELKATLSNFRHSLKSLPDLPHKVKEKISQQIQTSIDKIEKHIKQKDFEAKQQAWQEMARKSDIIKKIYRDVYSSQKNAAEPSWSSLEDEFNSQQVLPAATEKQFDLVWENLKAGSTSDLHVLNEEQARELCIAGEIAAGIDSPETDKSLRMQLQVSRLSEGLASGSENISREDKLEALLHDWYLSVLDFNSDIASYENRIETAKQQLFA